MSTSRRQFLAGTLAAAGATLVARPKIVGAKGASAAADAASPKPLSSWDGEAKKLLAQLSIEEKVGQMTQPDQMYLKDLDDLDKFHIGSLLSGGDSDPKTGNDLNSWTEMYDHYQARAVETHPRIPILYGVDAVHGHNNVVGATMFPQNVGLGCTRDAALIEKIGRVTAEEVRATGIQWAFGPCVTVPQDIRWGRTYEGYSESPDVVKALGEAAVRGLQGASLDDPLSVVACAKHFAGDGGTVFGTGLARWDVPGHPLLDQGDTRLSDADFRRIHLQGYITTVAAGVGTIMPSYSSWNGIKCSASYVLMTEILKQELGFEGFLISDYAAQKELAGSSKQQIETTINAGMDMVMVPDNYQEFIRLLLELARQGRVPMSRIDDAVLRILRVKFALGLMDPKRSQLADRGLHAKFGSAEHRAVARQAVAESLVMLKNDRGLLPLKKDARLHVAGKCADNIGNQCGGWTIKWQGESGNVTTGGTTILAALRKVAGESQVTYSEDGSGAKGAAVGIAVIGETPYAEMMGDRVEMTLGADDVAVVRNLKRAGIPVLVVVVSGRPLVIDEILPLADAVITAWLPGTEGDGVADVLY
ncbi:MAG TPA: glycoside hydrolase family 3 protein, partial [Terriglobia bacterium]|nr:glycoside hydrolase family 3 protein [Terriglobia bacterium]